MCCVPSCAVHSNEDNFSCTKTMTEDHKSQIFSRLMKITCPLKTYTRTPQRVRYQNPTKLPSHPPEPLRFFIFLLHPKLAFLVSSCPIAEGPLLSPQPQGVRRSACASSVARWPLRSVRSCSGVVLMWHKGQCHPWKLNSCLVYFVGH